MCEHFYQVPHKQEEEKKKHKDPKYIDKLIYSDKHREYYNWWLKGTPDTEEKRKNFAQINYPLDSDQYTWQIVLTYGTPVYAYCQSPPF